MHWETAELPKLPTQGRSLIFYKMVTIILGLGYGGNEDEVGFLN